MPNLPLTVMIVFARDSCILGGFRGDIMKTAIGQLSGLLALTALLACGDGVGDESGFVASLRIMHLSPDAPSLELTIDGTQSSEAASVDFGSSSAYHGFGVGVHAIQIDNTGDAVDRKSVV